MVAFPWQPQCPEGRGCSCGVRGPPLASARPHRPGHVLVAKGLAQSWGWWFCSLGGQGESKTPAGLREQCQ